MLQLSCGFVSKGLTKKLHRPVEIYKYHSEYLVPGEGLFDYGYDYPYAYSALMGAMVNDPQYASSNWGNWEQVSRHDIAAIWVAFF